MYKFELNEPYFLPHSACQLEFSLLAGQGLILVGENGLGKTTLLNRFYQDVQTSKVIIEQRALDFFYDRTLVDVQKILFAARSEVLDKEAFQFLWEKFGLAEKSERRLSTLSGGEGQALKLVCGLSQNAAIYFLDEPSQFLDEEKKKVLATYLNELKRQSKSLLMVEHDLGWVPGGWSVRELGTVDGAVKEVNTWTT